MKLSYEQIQSVAIGVDRVEEQDGLISFYRFTREQEAAYEKRSADFYNKCFSTAGIRLEFETDSPTLFLSVELKSSSSRRYFAHDVYVNHRLIGQLGGMVDAGENEKEVFSKCGEFYLGEGNKTVRIYFPWSFRSRIRELSLADGATLTPTKKTCRMISFGDSITHGYDAEHPSLSYASLLADALDANAVNKGIGGERFWPALAATKEGFEPDLITVAYGTNDWTHRTKEEWIEKATAFYRTLSANYPNTPIFALAPIWRKDKDLEKPAGPFADLPKHLERIASELPGVTVIDCYPFVPHHSYAYLDERLHPNDAGFGFYAAGVIREIKKHLS